MMGVNHFTKNKMLAGYAASKNVPMPVLAVYGSGMCILLGGLGVLLGIYVWWALGLLSLFLLLVSLKMHAFWNISDPQAKMADKIQFLKNTALLGAVLMMGAIPMPWMMSAM